MTTNKEEEGKKIGLLYGVNTLGAVSGVLFSGFYFLPLLGLKIMFLIAAAMNFLAAFFSSIHFIDPDPFMKTQKRQRWILDAHSGRISAVSYPTEDGAGLDELLAANFDARRRFVEHRLSEATRPEVSDTLRSPESHLVELDQ